MTKTCRVISTVFQCIEFVNVCLHMSYFWRMLSNFSFKLRQKCVFSQLWTFVVFVAFFVNEHAAYSCYLIKLFFFNYETYSAIKMLCHNKITSATTIIPGAGRCLVNFFYYRELNLCYQFGPLSKASDLYHDCVCVSRK